MQILTAIKYDVCGGCLGIDTERICGLAGTTLGVCLHVRDVVVFNN
jgi:hypothetical protein